MMFKKLWNKLFGKKTFEVTIQQAGNDPVIFYMKSIKVLTQTELKGEDIDENTINIVTTEPFDYLVKGGYNIGKMIESEPTPDDVEETAD